MEKYRKEVQPALGILRLNKQICDEAASIFYGENEFRFSSYRGWYTLDTWLKQIGKTNQKLVRMLAVHVPWAGRNGDYGKDSLPESKNQIRMIQRQLENVGLRPRKREEQIFQDTCVRHTARMLEAIGDLSAFRLIVPDSYFPITKDDWISEFDLRKWIDTDEDISQLPGKVLEFGFVLDRSKFKNLQIQLVYMRGGYSRSEDLDVPDAAFMQSGKSESRARALLYHLAPRKKAEMEDVEVLDVSYDLMGDYPVPMMEGDEVIKAEKRELKAHLR